MSAPGRAHVPDDEAVLRVRGLRVNTRARAGQGGLELLHGIDLTLGRGENLAVVGESGSGKSLLCLSVMGLLTEDLVASGSVVLRGERADRRPAGAGDGPRVQAPDLELLGRSERELAPLRGDRIGMVFQEPMTALDALRRVGDQVAEVMQVHDRLPRAPARRRALDLLGRVGLPDPARAFAAYPHELSGGQRQRVVLAAAMANSPDVLLADEPTTALDATVQRQVLTLVAEATAAAGTALVLVTHDLALAASVCTRVVVLRRGEVVEAGELRDVFTAPRHPYTRDLLQASGLLTPGDTAPAPLGPTPVAPPPADHPASARGEEEGSPAVVIHDLVRTYTRPRGPLGGRQQVTALTGVSLSVARGERFALVGESGSGKSTLLRMVAGLDAPTSGEVWVTGREVHGQPERQLRWLRRTLQIVFQDPTGSLDPRMRLWQLVTEALTGLSRAERRERAVRLLRDVALAADLVDRYPHQLSGGQRQRVAIARALAPEPRVLVADEAVSALDVSVRAQVLDLLDHLVAQRDLTLLLVTHDLTVVQRLCDTVAVLRAGEIVESGTVAQVLANPQQDYTAGLVAAVPRPAWEVSG